MWKCLHVKYSLFLSAFTETQTFATDFWKILNIKFHQNSSSGSWVVSCGHTDGWMDGWTDMTKPVVAFCSFANAPKRKENPVLGTNWLNDEEHLYTEGHHRISAVLPVWRQLASPPWSHVFLFTWGEIPKEHFPVIVLMCCVLLYAEDLFAKCIFIFICGANSYTWSYGMF